MTNDDSVSTPSQPSAGGQFGEIKGSPIKVAHSREDTIEALRKWAAEIRKNGALTGHVTADADAELLESAIAWLET